MLDELDLHLSNAGGCGDRGSGSKGRRLRAQNEATRLRVSLALATKLALLSLAQDGASRT